MPVITSDFSLRVDTLEQFAGRLVRWVLRYKFAVNSEVEDFGFCQTNNSLYSSFAFFDFINYT